MKKGILWLSIFIIFLFSSCQYFTLLSNKEWMENSTGYNNEVDVYVAGQDNGGSIPRYWKNNKYFDFKTEYAVNGPDTNSISSIFVDQSDNIYCGGCYETASVSYNACYWINGKKIKVKVDSESNNSLITSITVKDGIVYSCGYESNISCFWINKEKHYYELPSGAGNNFAKSIAVDENFNIHTAGTCDIGGPFFAVYWENKKYLLLDNNQSRADSESGDGSGSFYEAAINFNLRPPKLLTKE